MVAGFWDSSLFFAGFCVPILGRLLVFVSRWGLCPNFGVGVCVPILGLGLGFMCPNFGFL